MPRRLSWITALGVLASPAIALSHENDDPDAHLSMPNQVVAGVSPLCFARYAGEVRSGTSREAIGADGVPCLGVTIGYARELGRHFDLRLRLSYRKPLPDDERLLDGLHEFYGTLAPELVAYRLADALTLTLGPEIGVYAAMLSLDDATYGEDAAPGGVGWTLAMTAGVRPWITYHTGFFAEVSAGVAHLSSDDLGLRMGFLGRLTVGWADRF